MGSSGLIYAGIVLAWAAFLVPMWLRRHDERAAARAADSFSAAMRVLARRQSAADPAGAGRPSASRRRRLADRLPIRLPRARRRRAPDVVVRRRLLLGVLAGLLLLATAAAALGRLPLAAVAAPALLLAAYSALLVRTTRLRAAARASAWRAPAPPLRRPQPQPAPVPAAAPAPAARVAPAAVDVAAAGHVLRPHSPAAEVEPVELAPPAGGPADAGAWQPVPVPLPTYVTAPKAQRTIRTIDLSAPGAWTSGLLAAPPEGTADVADRAGAADPDERLPAWAGSTTVFTTGPDDVPARRAVND